MSTPTSAAVIGAGPAGLFCAHLLSQAGVRVALFDSHSKPGGCASFFRRRVRTRNGTEEPVVFDAGATVLNRMAEGEFLSNLVSSFGVAPAGPFDPMRSIRVVLPGEAPVELSCRSLEDHLASLRIAFPQDDALITGPLARLARHAQRLQQAFERVPHLPIESFGDVRRDLRLLPALWPALPSFALGLARSFGDVLEPASARLKRWAEMTLLITLQCSPSEAHPLYGAMGFFYYGLGCGSLDGGMKSLFLPMLESFKSKPNAQAYMRTPVERIERAPGRAYRIVAGGTTYGPFDAVFSSLPRFDTQRLSSERVIHSSESFEALERELWSAFVGYYALVDDARWPDHAFHAHVSRATEGARAPDGGDVYLSFSRRGDALRAPEGMRAATLSTHVSMPTARFFASDYGKEIKAAEGISMLRWALDAALPTPPTVLHEEFGSPRTFHRYTKRSGGAVGGLPLSRAHSFFSAPSQRLKLERFYQIGDTAFPGQSVYACAVGAAAAVEKYTGKDTGKFIGARVL